MKATKPSKTPRTFLWQKIILVVALSLMAVALAPPLAHTSASAQEAMAPETATAPQIVVAAPSANLDQSWLEAA